MKDRAVSQNREDSPCRRYTDGVYQGEEGLGPQCTSLEMCLGYYFKGMATSRLHDTLSVGQGWRAQQKEQ